MNEKAIVGSLLGTAVGDALGLPYEGLSRRRGRRLYGEPNRYHLLPGRGLVSDDTEHACMVAQALIASGDDPEMFLRELSRRLKGWLLALPAGTGKATAQAILKLCVGISPKRSGVFSAGNGPAMRSPSLGAAIEDLELLHQFVRASARITHTDPKAEYGAWSVALAARMATMQTRVDPKDYAKALGESLPGESAEEILKLVEQAVNSREKQEPMEDFAASLGFDRGVSGYIYHTLPIVLHAWFSHPTDFRLAVQTVIRCGGDTDSTAAIVGGIVGSTVGKEGIPKEWWEGLCEWPRSVRWMEELGTVLSETRQNQAIGKPPRLPIWGVLMRNLIFLAIVLAHGFRRLLPPY